MKKSSSFCVAVIGASGFIGHEIFKFFSKEDNLKVIGTYKKKLENSLIFLDSEKKLQVKKFIKKYNPDIIIDTVALSNSLDCEKNPKLCRKTNYVTAKNLLKISNKFNKKMIFISSSYVFDGLKEKYLEEDSPNPLNLYGKEKLNAEKLVLKSKNSIIIRIDLAYGYNQNRNSNGILGFVSKKDTIYLKNPNQLRSPIFIEDIPKILLKLIEENCTGIYHLAGPDCLKMRDFLKKFGQLFHKRTKIFKSTNKSLVKSPKRSCLNIKKINSLGIKTISIQEGFDSLKKKIKSS